jgi:hypothetical protein
MREQHELIFSQLCEKHMADMFQAKMRSAQFTLSDLQRALSDDGRNDISD